MRHHLWYLSEDLACLPLFSDDLGDDEKQVMVNALQKIPNEDDVRRLSPKAIETFSSLSGMSTFITSRSLNLFDALSLLKDFLAAPVGTWLQRHDYKAAREIVEALKVVNDCAERSVKLATDFNEVLTTDENQR